MMVDYLEYETINKRSFRFNKLKQHLDTYNAPLFVSVVEDATRAMHCVDYDSKTDHCVGFILPLDENGILKIDSFIRSCFIFCH